jgi:hypothetical protein
MHNTGNYFTTQISVEVHFYPEETHFSKQCLIEDVIANGLYSDTVLKFCTSPTVEYDE